MIGRSCLNAVEGSVDSEPFSFIHIEKDNGPKKILYLLIADSPITLKSISQRKIWGCLNNLIT